MKTFSPGKIVAASLLATVALAAALRAVDMPANHPTVGKLSAADLQFFETKIRPILVQKCYNCHSKEADKVRGGLLLDTREGMLQGGNTGPSLVPGKPSESLLIQAISYKDEDLQMPPKGEKLSDEQIALLTEWVKRGAPDPRTAALKGASGVAYGGVGKNHWAFQPVKKPALPTVQNTSWVKNAIDNFVLAKLEENGMTPNAPADRATLIRRLYFDLIGLPPHPADVIEFVNDKAPNAVEKVVDKLLATPQYGEHWARYWLDVARYSDTKGDAPRQDDLRNAHAWTYRDWVIEAFNADLPYNQFVYAQLAGDYLTANIERAAKAKGKTIEQKPMLAALGFLTLGNQFNGRRDDIIGDQIDVTTKAFLGLTVGCARCHDHKFDPIPTKDYYSLYGVFANSQPVSDYRGMPTLQAKVQETADYQDYLRKSAELGEREKLVKAAEIAFRRGNAGKGGKAKGPAPAFSKEELIAKLKLDPDSNRPIPQQLQTINRNLYRDITDLELKHPGAPARANALFDVPRSRDYNVLIRGEAGNRGDVVPRRFLEVLSPDPKKRPEWREGSGRHQLAVAITDPKNPLTARVFVNRMWQQHWGQGFVETPDDLGNMTSKPTHPELLDWLSATFVENKWSIKSLHRMIVLSNAYQQSSQNNPAYAEKDPNNKLLWRYNLRRLGFEQVHDSLLAITGELNPLRGGKPVAISSEEFAHRRAVYTLIDRTNPAELLTQFDFPSPDVASGRRYETIVPQQALFLMNSPMVIETARKLVERPAFAQLKSDGERVTLLYLAIFQRWPTKQEVELGMKYVNANPQGTGLDMPEVPPAVAARMNPKDMRKAQNPKAAQAKFSTQVGGVYEKYVPLNAWTKLAHALFQTNESMFYN